MTSRAEPVMTMYTIYHRPSDYPDVEFLVMAVHISPGVTEPGAVIGVALTLDEARDLVPAPADQLLPRSPADDPVIVESWV